MDLSHIHLAVTCRVLKSHADSIIVIFTKRFDLQHWIKLFIAD
jgi:hypothetical protein